jgi:hypothetical protein
MTTRHRLPTVLVLGVAGLLAACGGSGGNGGSANRPDDSKQLAFAACLRKAGIDAPDPQHGPNGEVRQSIRVPKGISPKRMQQIQKDCQRQSGFSPKPPSKEEQARFRDAALKFARCMRAHGVDVPDPQPGSGGINIQKRGSGNGPGTAHVAPDLSSPAFKRAQEACQSLMPGGKGGMRLDSVGGGPGVGSASK